MPTIKHPEIFKQGLGLTIAGLVLVGICAGAWFMWQDRYWIAQAGPKEITLEQLGKLEDPSQLPSRWIKVTFEKGVDTGIEMTEVGAGITRTEYKFLLFQAGDRWMVATVPEEFRGNTLAGEIYRSTNPEDTAAFVEIYEKLKEVHGGRMFPFEFRADLDFGENWTYFAYVVGGFGTLCLVLAAAGIHMCVQAFREPSDRRGTYGSRESFNSREEELEEELEAFRR
jgi:hypothetical protein